MAKTNNLNPEVQKLEELKGSKYIQLFSLAAFLALGIWMMISPEQPEHSAVEKGTVYIMKEIWSWPAGFVITILAVFLTTLLLLRLRTLNGSVWIKAKQGGYYLLSNKQRISGLSSIYDGKDLVVFHPEKDMVVRFKKYTTASVGKYRKVVVDKKYSCDKTYWNADDSGYALIRRGKSLTGLSSKRENDDLFVTEKENNYKFKLSNYYNRKDNRIYEATVLN